MLLAELKTKAEKDAFMNLAYAVASADGCMSYAALTLIGVFKNEMGSDMKHEQRSITDACQAFEGQCKKRIVLMNLFCLAGIDGCNSSPQKHILEEIRRELHVDPKELASFEQEMNIVKAPYYPNYME